MKPIIRQEMISDNSIVFRINQLAFGREDEAHLVDRLRKSSAFVPELSLVAVNGAELVAYLLFTKIQIINVQHDVHNSLALAPVAVLPSHQNHGIGSQLIRYGLDKARILGFKSVIVLGHEHYYPRFGFEPAVKWQIFPSFKVSASAFMALELQPKALNGVRGTVKYDKAFELS